MWHWKKQIAAEHEQEWQQRLSTLPWVAFTELPHAKRLLIDVYSEELADILALHTCYGGSYASEEEIDWVAATAPANTPPLLIRNKLVISASEEQSVLDDLRQRYPKRIILSFPAERAFGTGNHGTTSTCLRMLCDEAKLRRGAPWRIIDAGCGTGVLGLAAVRMGAQSGICYDFDPTAVEVAKRNMERNGGEPALRVIQADVFEWTPAPAERADVMLANLFSTILQKAFPRLRAALAGPESVLIASGILCEQADETLLAAQNTGFSLLKKAVCGKWVTLKLSPGA